MLKEISTKVAAKVEADKIAAEAAIQHATNTLIQNTPFIPFVMVAPGYYPQNYPQNYPPQGFPPQSQTNLPQPQDNLPNLVQPPSNSHSKSFLPSNTYSLPSNLYSLPPAGYGSTPAPPGTFPSAHPSNLNSSSNPHVSLPSNSVPTFISDYPN
ncbi:MAG: hypothetical protein LBB45_03740 [Methanobrevibacter sp.]|nr:hypothetical protein [Candidatus Methanovirga basalitermitum]